MNDSVITCDEITEMDTETKSNDKAKPNDGEAKTIPTNFNEKIYEISTFSKLVVLIHYNVSSAKEMNTLKK